MYYKPQQFLQLHDYSLQQLATKATHSAMSRTIPRYPWADPRYDEIRDSRQGQNDPSQAHLPSPPGSNEARIMSNDVLTPSLNGSPGSTTVLQTLTPAQLPEQRRLQRQYDAYNNEKLSTLLPKVINISGNHTYDAGTTDIFLDNDTSTSLDGHSGTSTISSGQLQHDFRRMPSSLIRGPLAPNPAKANWNPYYKGTTGYAKLSTLPPAPTMPVSTCDTHGSGRGAVYEEPIESEAGLQNGWMEPATHETLQQLANRLPSEMARLEALRSDRILEQQQHTALVQERLRQSLLVDQQRVTQALPAQRPEASNSPTRRGFRPMQAIKNDGAHRQAEMVLQQQQLQQQFQQQSLDSQMLPSFRFSTRYHGMHTENNASAEHLRAEQNCSLWLTNLPPGIEVHELLAHVRNTGRVWCTYINAADNVRHRTAAAKLVFFTPEAAGRLLLQSWTQGLYVRGYLVRVAHNRIKSAQHEPVGRMSRVLIITGEPSFVNKGNLIRYFKERFVFEIDQVLDLITTKDRCVIEFRFGSYRCQAQMGKMALEKDQPLGFEKVEFGDDPCEVGDTSGTSYGIAAQRILGMGIGM